MKIVIICLICLLSIGCAIPPIIPLWKPKVNGQDQSRNSNKTYNMKFSGRTTAAEGAATMKILLNAEGKLEKAEAAKEKAIAERYEAIARANRWKEYAMSAIVIAVIFFLINFLSGGYLLRKAKAYRQRLHDEEAQHKKALKHGNFEKAAPLDHLE